MDLPKDIKTFTFESVGLTTTKKYDGDFTVKCVLNMRDKRLLEIEKSSIRADMANPTPDLVAYSTILSNLRVRIEDGPEWWKQSTGGYDLKDENTLIELFDKVMDQETLWRKEVKAMGEEGNPNPNPQTES